MSQAPRRTTRCLAWAYALLCSLALLASACGGDDEAAPLSLEERLVQPNDVPDGFEPNGQPESMTDPAGFVALIEDSLVQLTPEETRKALADAGFVAGADGGLVDESAPAEIGSAALQFESEEGAKEAFDVRHKDALLPCRDRCDIEISEFDVPDIPLAAGIQRSKTEASSAGAGEGPPFDSYEVSFVDGPFLYVLRGIGPPGVLSQDDFIAAAQALYERVKGVPAPSS
jgi:hypothetical protein